MDKDKNKIGKFLQKLREEKYLTQEELARMIPISREAISKWERGTTKPSKSSVIRLSEIFEVSIEEILSGKRLDKYNKDLVFELYNEKNRLQKGIKILIGIILTTIILIFIYIFLNTYNSIKIYTISCDENDVLITNGIFVITKDKLYFNLGNINNSENIEYLKLYYIYNNDTKIISGVDDSSLILFDYYGYDGCFDTENIDSIVSNLYLEITFKETFEVKKVKLNLKKDFSNNYTYFFNRKREMGIEEKELKPEVLDIKKIKEKVKYNSLYQNYVIAVIEEANLINVFLDSQEEKIEWNYNNTHDFLDIKIYKNDKLINSFYKNNDGLFCNIENCTKKEALIDEFYDLMNTISK